MSTTKQNTSKTHWKVVKMKKNDERQQNESDKLFENNEKADDEVENTSGNEFEDEEQKAKTPRSKRPHSQRKLLEQESERNRLRQLDLQQQQLLLLQQEQLLRKLKQQQQELDEGDAAPETASAQQQQYEEHEEHEQSDDSNSEMDSARLAEHLEELANLSKEDFEQNFRQWMEKQGIEQDLTAHLRANLIENFNSTQLGKALTKLSNEAQNVELMLTPWALMLYTLVADFLLLHNLHFTLSVYCSEMPFPQSLPDFETRTPFRFNTTEVNDFIRVLVGATKETPALLTLRADVQRSYEQSEDSLLITIIRVLTQEFCSRQVQLIDTATMTEAEQKPESTSMEHEAMPTLENNPVFIGPRIQQALQKFDQNFTEVAQVMRHLAKSCAPPVEVISMQALNKLVKLELLERQQLAEAGQPVPRSKLALPHLLPKPAPVPSEESTPQFIESPLGRIEMPKPSLSMPTIPELHSEQLITQVMVQKLINQLESHKRQTPEKLAAALERIASSTNDIFNSVMALSNVLNLAMEQEHSVGYLKGFKTGYKEGFRHGHFLGTQEGRQLQQQNVNSTAELPIPAAVRQRHMATSMEQALPNQRHISTSTEQAAVRSQHTATTNTEHAAVTQQNMATNTEQVKANQQDMATNTEQAATKQRHMATGTEQTALQSRHMATNTEQAAVKQKNMATSTEQIASKQRHMGTSMDNDATRRKHMATSTNPTKVHNTHTQTGPDKRYEQWIFEMLHTKSGQVFLERVELSLSKALDLQKQRLNELYEIKLRHQSEMIRIKNRQSSWQTLCRRVERDSAGQSRELVRKIFTLLEHYEDHHKALLEKIQQSELAAEKASHTTHTLAQSDLVVAQPTLSSAVLTNAVSETIADEIRQQLSMTPVQAMPQKSETMPSKHTVATNTPPARLPAKEHYAESVPNFDELLRSAKNRIMELEQESDMLERSFRNYLERNNVEKHVAEKATRKIRAGCAQERQQINETLDTFRVWQRRCKQDGDTKYADMAEQIEQQALTLAGQSNKQLAKEAMPLHKPQQRNEGYTFNNAISLARRRLLADLDAWAVPQEVDNQPQPDEPYKEDWSYMDKLLASQVSKWCCRHATQTTTEQLLGQDTAKLRKEPTEMSRLLMEVDDKMFTFITPSSTSSERNWQLMQHAKLSVSQPPHGAAPLTTVLEHSGEHSGSTSWRQRAGGGDSLDNCSSVATPLSSSPVTKNVGDACNMPVNQTSSRRKLESSMNRIQQLFSSPIAPEPANAAHTKDQQLRPLSAPAGQTAANLSTNLIKRPRTAPAPVGLAAASTTTISLGLALPTATAAVNKTAPGYLDTIDLQFESYMNEYSASDNSRCSSRFKLAPSSCVVPTTLSTSLTSPSLVSSPEASYSQEFWQRMNL